MAAGESTQGGSSVVDVSVVIPTYNQGALLGECVRALAEQTLPAKAYEIIVVDDGSTDDTADRLSAFQGGPARVRVVRLPTNRGRSAARNAGVREAAAPVVVFTDSDIIVRPDFLARHLQTHRVHGDHILSRGPVVLVPDVTTARAAPLPRLSALAASPAYLDSANAGVARSVVLAAGLFDERFPGYGWEDFELGYRLQTQGVRRVFVREAVAFHVQPPPDPDALPVLVEKEDARARSAVYFYRKHPNLQSRWLIQATPVHRGLYWLMAGGGLLSPARAARMAARLSGIGWHGSAHLVLRCALNRHYLQMLRRELQLHDAALA